MDLLPIYTSGGNIKSVRFGVPLDSLTAVPYTLVELWAYGDLLSG